MTATTCASEDYYNQAAYSYVYMPLSTLQQWLDLLTGKSVYTPPSQMWLGLFLPGFVPYPEVPTSTWSTYTRQSLPLGGWSPASNALSLYGNKVEFGVDNTFFNNDIYSNFLAAMTFMQVMDASTGGNVLFTSQLQLNFGGAPNLHLNYGTHYWSVANTLGLGFSSITNPLWGNTYTDNWLNGAGFNVTYLNRLIDHYTSVAPFGTPPDLYLALLTSPCTDAGIGTEVVYSGYARVHVPPVNLSNSYISGNSAYVNNTVDIVFPVYTGGVSLLVSYFALMDDPTGGNVVGGGYFQSSPVIGASVLSGTPPTIPANSRLLRFRQFWFDH